MNASGAQLLRQFSNDSLNGSIACGGSDVKSPGYIGVADWIVIKPVIDSPVQKFFALAYIRLLQPIEKAMFNVNGPVPDSPT